MELKARRIETADALDAIELCYARGWTDGLPVIPPTEERVRAMLEGVCMEPGTVLGAIPERNRVFTAEVVAVNAVMAGCLPDYFPVVVTAVSAMCEPAFGLHGPSASTHGPAMLIIVNGPVTQGIGLNSGQGLFGAPHRANATIGRAVRLLLINAGGSPQFDRSTLSHPGKYSYCIAENEETEWTPLHVQRGFDRQTSTVTVFAAEGPQQVNHHSGSKAEHILLTLADKMRSLGSFNMGGVVEMAVVICPEHYRSLVAQGWDKPRVQEFLHLHAARPRAELKSMGYLDSPAAPDDDTAMVHAVPNPDALLLVTAGGEAGRFSACIPGWARMQASRAVTRAIGDITCGT